MHSMILDHYTQSPFNNSCHRRYSLPPRNTGTKSQSDTPPKEPLLPTMSSLPGQSVLTWSPGEVLMTSPLVSWSPYLTTMATSPTAKYSLDLQISCKRTDSGFEDITTSPTGDRKGIPTAPRQFEDAIMPPVEFEDAYLSNKASNVLPAQDQEVTPLAPLSPRSPTPVPTENGNSPASSSIEGTRPRRAKRVPPVGSKPATPRTSRPSSRSDRDFHCRSTSSTCGTIHSMRSSSSPQNPTHRFSSSRSIDSQTRGNRPSSSRRSSTFSVRQTTSRTESFILGRNEPRPIDLEGVIRRTKEQQASNPTTMTTSLQPEPAQDEAQAEPAMHSPVPDYPIDWTGKDSRAAQYAAIDRKNRGVKGLCRRVKRKLKLGKRKSDFYDGGSDAGSVRRYRLDMDDAREKV